MEFDLPRTRTRESLQFEVVTIFDDNNCSQSMSWSPILKEKGGKIKEKKWSVTYLSIVSNCIPIWFQLKLFKK